MLRPIKVVLPTFSSGRNMAHRSVMAVIAGTRKRGTVLKQRNVRHCLDFYRIRQNAFNKVGRTT